MDLSALGAVSTLLVGAIVVMAERRWLILLGFALHYLAVTLLVMPLLGSEIAITKLITGFIAGGILWVSTREHTREPATPSADLIDRSLFRISLLALVLTAGWGIGRAAWLNIPGLSPPAEIGATMLLALGLMLAAFFESPLRMGLGIIVCVSGFEVIYAAVEPSLAVLALLAGVQLSLALVVGYLVQLDLRQKEGLG